MPYGHYRVLRGSNLPNKLLDKLVSYWPLDEQSGNRRDLVGNNTLTDNATVTGNPGPSSNLVLASQFTALNTEYLSITSNSSLQTGDIDFTWCFWVYLDSITGQMMFVAKYGSAGFREYLVGLNGAGTRWLIEVSSDGTAAVSNAAGTLVPTTTAWHFLVAWHDSINDTLNLQVDNDTLGSTAYSSGVFVGTEDLRIGFGNAAGDTATNGRICGVGFWKRVLDASERTWLYKDGIGRLYPFRK